MLTHCHVGQPVLTSTGLDLEKRQQRAHLFLDRIQTDQEIEVSLNFGQRARGTSWRGESGPTEPLGQELLGVPASIVARLKQQSSEFVR